MATKRTFTGTSPDGRTSATVTTAREAWWITWAKWDTDTAKHRAGEWFQVGVSTVADYEKAAKAARSTNPNFPHTDATPATEI